MTLCFRELKESRSITDAVYLHTLGIGGGTLVVASGNKVFLFPMSSGEPQKPRVFTFYGTIKRVIGLSEDNIMVITNDLNAGIISIISEEITFPGGSLLTEHNPPQLLIAQHPDAIAIRLSSNDVEIFPINPMGGIDRSFNVGSSGKTILDMAFVGPVSRIARLAVLSLEDNNQRKIYVFELDLKNHKYTEMHDSEVTLDQEVYQLICIQPEDISCVVGFSYNKAIRINYSAGLTPVVTTAAIFTPHKLKSVVPLHDSSYIALDEDDMLRYVMIQEDGPVHFRNLIKVQDPAAIVPLSPTEVFVASVSGESSFVHIDDESPIPTAIETENLLRNYFAGTGEFKRFAQTDDKIYAIADSTFTTIQTQCSLKIIKEFNLEGCSMAFGEGDFWVLSNDLECFAVVNGVPHSIPIKNLVHCMITDTYIVAVHNSQISVVQKEDFSTKSTIYIEPSLSLVASDPNSICVACSNNEIQYYTAGPDDIERISIYKEMKSIQALAVSGQNCYYCTKNQLIKKSSFDTREIALSCGILVASNHDQVAVLIQCGDVLVFDSDLVPLLNAPLHASSLFFSSNGLVTLGDRLYLLDGNKFVQIDSNGCCYGGSNQDSIYLLDRNQLRVAQIQKPSMQCKTFISKESPLIDICSYQEHTIMLRKLDREQVLLMENHEITRYGIQVQLKLIPFAGFLLIVSGTFLDVYAYDPREYLVKMNTIEHEKITDAVVYQGYLMIANEKTLELCTISSKDGLLCLKAEIEHKVQSVISKISCGSNMFVLLFENCRAIGYKLIDGFQVKSIGDLPRLKPYKHIILFNGNLIECMDEGEIFIYGLHPISDPLKNYYVPLSMFNIGEPILIARSFIDFVLFGTSSGAVWKLDDNLKLSCDAKRVYAKATEYFTSVGSLNKFMQRGVREGIDYPDIPIVCEESFLKEIHSHPLNDLKQLLRDKTLTQDLIDEFA